MPVPRSPSADRSGAARTPQVRVGLDRDRRTRWVFAGVLLVVLAAIGAPSVAGIDPGSPWSVARGLLGAAPALLVGALCLLRLPRLFTRQGMRADETGIAFVQEPLWWFRGRALEVPWSGIRAIRSDPPFTSARPGGDPDAEHQRLSVFLVHRPADPLPFWLNEDEALPEPGDEPLMPRVHTSWGLSERDRVLAFVRARQPDLLDGTAPSAPAQRAATGADGPRDTGAPQNTDAAQDIDALLDVRGARILSWSGYTAASLVMSAPTAAIAVGLTEPGAAASAGTSGLVAFGLLAAVALGLAGYTVAVTPRMWTAQYVRLHGSGITLAQERRWWSPERTVTVPWEAVARLEVREKRAGRNHYPAVAMHLDRPLPQGAAPPSWTRSSEEEETVGGRTVRGTVLSVEPGHHGPAVRLVSLLRDARPDLFGPVIAPAPPREEEPDPRGVPAAVRAEPFRADLRRRRARTWAAGFLFCLYGLGAVSTIGVMDAARMVERQEYGMLVAPLFWGAVLIGLTVWSVRSAPRCLARQAVVVDGEGIRLVQEALWWSPDRSASIPWEQVRHARTERADPDRPGSAHVFKLFLTGPGLVPRVPSWCTLSEWEENDLPAHRGRPMTRITVKPTARAAGTLARAVQAARPDLADPNRPLR